LQTPIRILLTGAAGMAATGIRPLLRQAGHELTLLDVDEVSDVHESERFVRASMTDAAALAAAMDGVELVAHLGGFSSEASWRDILETNIDGTQRVLEAAHAAGVDRVLLASSTHAIGYWPVGTDASQLHPRPDSYYGVSKAALEALGSLYADRFGMTVVSARIGTLGDTPGTERHRRTWLSYADLVRLIEATATTTAGGHHIVYAISANERRWYPLEPGHAIGYFPQDDAEEWGPFEPADEDPDTSVLGGAKPDPTRPLGES
jgi:uronate dehydrogenase